MSTPAQMMAAMRGGVDPRSSASNTLHTHTAGAACDNCAPPSLSIFEMAAARRAIANAVAFARSNNLAGEKLAREFNTRTTSTDGSSSGGGDAGDAARGSLEEAFNDHATHDQALQLHTKAAKICQDAFEQHAMGQAPLNLCRELASAEQSRAGLLLAAGRLDEAAAAADNGLEYIDKVVVATAAVSVPDDAEAAEAARIADISAQQKLQFYKECTLGKLCKSQTSTLRSERPGGGSGGSSDAVDEAEAKTSGGGGGGAIGGSIEKEGGAETKTPEEDVAKEVGRLMALLR